MATDASATTTSGSAGSASARGPQAFSLAGREAIATGATKRVSAAVALTLARAGADVAMLGRDPEGLATTEAVVRAEGREC